MYMGKRQVSFSLLSLVYIEAKSFILIQCSMILAKPACPESPLSPPPNCWNYIRPLRLPSICVGAEVLYAVPHIYLGTAQQTEVSLSLQHVYYVLFPYAIRILCEAETGNIALIGTWQSFKNVPCLFYSVNGESQT